MGAYGDGSYWKERQDLLYYKYLDFIIRSIGQKAVSLLDVGTGNCPYLEWFDWIPDRVSFDRRNPYTSPSVKGLEGDLLKYKFAQSYDIVTCLQVLEHVPEPKPFASKLLELSTTLIISVPYNWPKGKCKGHINDPVDTEVLKKWFSRDPNYSIIVEEPFRHVCHERLIAIYCKESNIKFTKYRSTRFLREMGESYRQDE